MLFQQPTISDASFESLQSSFKNKVVVGYYDPFYKGVRNGIELPTGSIIKHRLFSFSRLYGFGENMYLSSPNFMYYNIPDEPRLFEIIRRNHTVLPDIEIPPVSAFFRGISIFHAAAFFFDSEAAIYNFDRASECPVIIDKIFDHFPFDPDAVVTPLDPLPSPFQLACQTGNIAFVKKMITVWPHLINKPFPSGVSPLRYVIDFIVSINKTYDTVEDFFQLFSGRFEEHISEVKRDHINHNQGPLDHPFSMHYMPLMEEINSDKLMYNLAKFLFEHGANYF